MPQEIPRQILIKTKKSLFERIKSKDGRPFIVTVIVFISALLLGSVGFSSNILNLIGGPFWWTTPLIDPPSTSDPFEPFNVLFTVNNRSSIFGTNVHFKCHFILVQHELNNREEDNWAETNGIYYIPPLYYPSFKCWYPFKIAGKIVFADLEIIMTYSHNLPWNDTKTISAGRFQWDAQSGPPRWVRGVIMR